MDEELPTPIERVLNSLPNSIEELDGTVLNPNGTFTSPKGNGIISISGQNWITNLPELSDTFVDAYSQSALGALLLMLDSLAVKETLQ